jgi:hypothetical protein
MGTPWCRGGVVVFLALHYSKGVRAIVLSVTPTPNWKGTHVCRDAVLNDRIEKPAAQFHWISNFEFRKRWYG